MNRAREIEQLAATWIIRREEPSWSASDEQDLLAWLGQSNAHRAAFWRLEHGWTQADRIASLGQKSPRTVRGTWSKFLTPAAVAAAVALITFGFLYRSSMFPTDPNDVHLTRLETSLGGHRTVSLADGSRVELNTDTMIEASLNDSDRRLWLQKGEAYFEVTRADQAFVVMAGNSTVTVLGTRFVVRRSASNTTVSVIEGRVRLDDRSRHQSPTSAVLDAGSIAVAEKGSLTITSSSPALITEGLAWRSGMLAFRDTRLSDAAEQFNRYNAIKLEVSDREAANLRIGGSFKTSNVDGFVRLLQDAYGLQVRREGSKILITG
jgi:transmembrane sensor